MSRRKTKYIFEVIGTPKAQPRPRAFASKSGKARVYDASTAEGWKSCIAVAAQQQLPVKALAGPIKLSVTFVMPRPKAHFGTGKNAGVLKEKHQSYYHIQKPDTDNLVKALMDCLSTLDAWGDDCQVCSLMARKVWVSPPLGRPGAWITVEEIEDE